MIIQKQVVQGDSFELVSEMYDDKARELPSDLTGATVTLAAAQCDGTGQIDLSGAIAGHVATFTADPAATAAWASGLWNAEIRITTGGEVSTTDRFELFVREAL